MKVYHTIRIGTYNAAAFFVDQRIPVTSVTCNGGIYQFYVGDDIAAVYSELDGILQVYVNVNNNVRCYGKLW